MEEHRRGKALSGRDTMLILFGLSSVFGILNFRMLVDSPNLSPLGGLMSLLFVVIWVYFAISSGWNQNRGFVVAAAILWGLSLVYLVWNYTSGGQFVSENETLASILSPFAMILLLFATATVVPLFQGLGMLGFVMDSSLRLLLVCIVSMAVLAVLYLLGMFFAKRADALQKRNPPPSP